MLTFPTFLPAWLAATLVCFFFNLENADSGIWAFISERKKWCSWQSLDNKSDIAIGLETIMCLTHRHVIHFEISLGICQLLYVASEPKVIRIVKKLIIIRSSYCSLLVSGSLTSAYMYHSNIWVAWVQLVSYSYHCAKITAKQGQVLYLPAEFEECCAVTVS